MTAGGAGSGTLALTGATGLVGGAVLAAASGPVRALYRSAPGAGQAEWVRGDLGDDAALTRLCNGASVVVHAAGLTSAGREAAFDAVNVEGAARAAAAARRAGAKRFVHISSQAARAPSLSAYARSKRLGEAAVLRTAGPMPVSIVRPPAVFGPGDEATAPIFAAIRRGVLPVPGGRQWRGRRFAAVTAESLATEILRIAEVGGRGPFEPASFPDLSWEELADAAAMAGHPVRLVPVPPLLLRLAGGIADGTGAATGRPHVFGRGKVEEMLQRDWRAQGEVLAGASLHECLRPLLGPGRAERQRADADRAAPINEPAAPAATGHPS